MEIPIYDTLVIYYVSEQVSSVKNKSGLDIKYTRPSIRIASSVFERPKT